MRLDLVAEKLYFQDFGTKTRYKGRPNIKNGVSSSQNARDGDGPLSQR